MTMSDGEHCTNDANCWCKPKIETLENGNKVIIHNRISPEEVIFNHDYTLDKILLAKYSVNSTAKLLREIRKIRKMSMLEVAEKSGINRNTISAIECGESINRASVSTLSSIAHALGCDLRIDLIPFETITHEK